MRYLMPLSIAVGAIASGAATRYYTFSGNIWEIDKGIAAYADSLGIRIGDAASYVFAVDTARPGYIMTNGSSTPMPDSQGAGPSSRRFFFDSLAAPSLFSATVEDKRSGSYFGFRTVITTSMRTTYDLNLEAEIGGLMQRTQVRVLFSVPDTLDILPKPGAFCHIYETYTGNGIFATVDIGAVLTAVEDSPPNPLRPPKPREMRPRLSRRDGAWVITGPEGVPMRAALFDASGRTWTGLRWTGSAELYNGNYPAIPYFLRLERDRQAPGR